MVRLVHTFAQTLAAMEREEDVVSLRSFSPTHLRGPSGAAMLRWRALLHMLTLRVVGSGLPHAPTLDDSALLIERAREELEGLEATIEAYQCVQGVDLSDALRDAAALAPVPGSWLEVVVAQLVLGVAALLQSHGSVADRAHKAENVAAARSALRDLRAVSPAAFDGMSALLTRWLDVACGALDDWDRSACLAALQRELASAPL